MRVLMLNYEYPPLGGGAANAMHYMLREFAKGDIEIDVITSNVGHEFEREEFSDAITIHKLNVHKKDIHYWKKRELFLWLVKAHSLTKELLQKEKYDVMHCWFGWPGGMIGYQFRGRVPYIVSLRGSDVPGFNPRLKWLDPLVFTPISRRVWRHARAVIANSEGLRRLALRTLDGEIEVIHNGVDTEEFTPEKRKSGDTFRIVSTGRLIERKGYEYLIRALEGMENVTLTVIGDGDRRPDLERLADKLGVRAFFRGAVDHDDIAREYQKADLFVLPSLNEGMSNSLLEAMACGLPVIVTDVGGAGELVDGNGIIVHRASADDLHDGIKGYLKDRELLRIHALRSREVAERMDWTSVCNRYLTLYGSAVCGRSG